MQDRKKKDHGYLMSASVVPVYSLLICLRMCITAGGNLNSADDEGA